MGELYLPSLIEAVTKRGFQLHPYAEKFHCRNFPPHSSASTMCDHIESLNLSILALCVSSVGHHVYKCVYTYMCVCVCVYIHVCVCVCECVCVCVCVCAHVYVCVYVCVCMHKCVCMCVHVQACIRTYFSSHHNPPCHSTVFGRNSLDHRSLQQQKKLLSRGI